MSARDKALKLIALAVGSSSTEEARTAAMAAVRLISDHKLLEQAPAPAWPAQHGPTDEEIRNHAERYARNEAVRRAQSRAQAWNPTAWDDLQDLADLFKHAAWKCERCGESYSISRGPHVCKKPWDPAEHKRPDLPKGYTWALARHERCAKCGEIVHNETAVCRLMRTPTLAGEVRVREKYVYWHSSCFYREQHGE